jgi:hypothetical protein
MGLQQINIYIMYLSNVLFQWDCRMGNHKIKEIPRIEIKE